MAAALMLLIAGAVLLGSGRWFGAIPFVLGLLIILIFPHLLADEEP